MLPSETVSFHFLCSPLELALNSAGTRCLSQASHLSVVVKLFSGCFPSLRPISAIKPQAQGPGFCYIFSFCLNQTPSFPENSVVQELYKVFNEYLADTCGLVIRLAIISILFEPWSRKMVQGGNGQKLTLLVPMGSQF